MGTLALLECLPQAGITGHTQHQVHPLWDLGNRVKTLKEKEENAPYCIPPHLLLTLTRGRVLGIQSEISRPRLSTNLSAPSMISTRGWPVFRD